MKTKLLILIVLILFSCKPAKVKEKIKVTEEMEEVQNSKDTATNRLKSKVNLIEDFEVNTSFQIIPNLNKPDTIERIIKVKDKSGNQTEVKFNPSDLLIFNSDAKIQIELNAVKKELKQTKLENTRLKKALTTNQSKKKTKLNGFFDRLGKWFVIIILALIIYYLFFNDKKFSK